MIQTGRGAAAHTTLGEVGGDALDQVQPGRAGGHEVQLELWMGVQPGTYADLGVGRGVVEHDVQVCAELASRRFWAPSVSSRPGRRHYWRPRRTTVPSRPAESAVGDRYCRASDARGQRVLRCGPRRLVAQGGRLVDRLEAEYCARHQCTRHGHRPASGARRHRHSQSDQGTQFTSWAFTRRAIDSWLLPSMGSVGDCYDNATMESFWTRV
jgi:hypothetical protein